MTRAVTAPQAYIDALTDSDDEVVIPTHRSPAKLYQSPPPRPVTRPKIVSPVSTGPPSNPSKVTTPIYPLVKPHRSQDRTFDTLPLVLAEIRPKESTLPLAGMFH